jgi:hypothetical protein
MIFTYTSTIEQSTLYINQSIHMAPIDRLMIELNDQWSTCIFFFLEFPTFYTWKLSYLKTYDRP